ncbi:MAG: GAF domain-containing protein [Spirochaetes bacterium]|nr:GAF domain-containing protein [Spirochaetota bacterium]
MSDKKEISNAIIFDFINKIFNVKDVDNIFDLVIDTLKNSIRCSRISIMLIDNNKEYMILKKHTGIDYFITDGTKINIKTSYASQVIKSGEPLIINSMKKFGLIKQYSDFDAFIIYPLRVEDLINKKNIIGVVNLTNKINNKPFSEEDQRIIQNICANASLALQERLLN